MNKLPDQLEHKSHTYMGLHDELNTTKKCDIAATKLGFFIRHSVIIVIIIIESKQLENANENNK